MSEVVSAAILGCGNIGSRHLQGLLKLDAPLKIHVYDPSPESLKLALARATEIPCTAKTIQLHSQTESLPEQIDLAIIASLSVGRVPLVEVAVSRGCKYLIVEKIVCQSMAEYERILDLCREGQTKGWVNFQARYFGGYERLKGQILAAGKVSTLAAYGGNLGLASNGIHYLDTFSFLSGAQDLHICDVRLDDELHPSPRGCGLIDFSGTIRGRVGQCEFSISFVRSHKASIVLVIEGTESRWIVDQVQDLGLSASKAREWRWEHFSFESNLASETTHWIVNDLLRSGSCKLPTLIESRKYHEELFRVCNDHLRCVTGCEVDLCPVT